MTRLLLIRHAPTAWNEDMRLQGHSDIPLSEESRRRVATWQVPNEAEGFTWLSSPLSRARETAQILAGRLVAIDERLSEMSFGDWEGERLGELRQRLGAEMQANEDRGLDFQPPGGESPRMVLDRLKPLFREMAAARQDTVMVCHHGIIRAVMALAEDWPMLGKAPAKIIQAHAHMFRLRNDGHPETVAMNIPMERTGE